ncbi:AraC family transcriptional regulator [Psychrobacter lutiphocae]|uniref:AraC family transcriptional regulator n=1 Tax=Psychrobacter lutiphocae TaxID=540500 RepID=UPI00036604CD|nr:AraC family transcriptional regulator [Psychrobacter lutiphocae]
MDTKTWSETLKLSIKKYFPKNEEDFVNNIFLILPLLDMLSNVVFFVKDAQARYRVVNKTLVKRCGLDSHQQLLGLTTEQVFLQKRGAEYLTQDFKVLKKGVVIKDKLELHRYASGKMGWCITHKIPIYGLGQKIIAMVGVSIDVDNDNERVLRKHNQLAIVESYIKHNIDQRIKVSYLAEIAGLSQSQLERVFQTVLKMTPIQFIQKIRLEHAINLLSQPDLSITNISLSCGYADHSAFSRQFKQLTGLSPTSFRTSYL